MASTPASQVLGLKRYSRIHGTLLWEACSDNTNVGHTPQKVWCAQARAGSLWLPRAQLAHPTLQSRSSQYLKIHALLVAGNKEAYGPAPTPTITGIGESLFSALLPFLHNSHLSLASEPSDPAH